MSSSSPPRMGSPDRSVLLFRSAVALPALITMLIVLARWISAAGNSDDATAVVALSPPVMSGPIESASFGPPVPGVTSAAAAVEIEDGWIVLDRRSQQLVLLGRDGAFVRVAGGPGEGPGELAGAAHIAALGSAVAVLDRRGQNVDLFETDGSFRRRIPLTAPECLGSTVEKVVTQGEHVLILRRCLRGGADGAVKVERLDEQGRMETIMNRDLDDLRSGPRTPLEAPTIAVVQGRIHFALVPSRCVEQIGVALDEATSVCYPDVETPPLPDSLVRQLRGLQAQALRAGISVEIPRGLPPFVEVTEIGDRLAFAVPSRDGAAAVDVMDGTRLRRFQLPEGVGVFFGRTAMLLARDDLEGTAFAVLPLP